MVEKTPLTGAQRGLPAREGPRARVPAQQARSRRTAEKIVAAAVELLAEASFDELSVADIAGRAGVSVGGFYARFRGKQALLHYLHSTVFGGLLDRAHEQLSPAATDGLGARDVIERYMAMAVDGFRRHRVVLQQVSLQSRTSADGSFRRQVLELNIELHDLFRARLHERLEQVGHGHPRRGIDIALTATSAVMREYVLFNDLRPQFQSIEDGELVIELTDLFCAYIRIER